MYPYLTAEKLIHMDINGKSEDIYAIGWVLATLTEIHYSRKICKNLNETLNLKVTLTNNATTFKFLNKERYATTLKLIEVLLQSWEGRGTLLDDIHDKPLVNLKSYF